MLSCTTSRRASSSSPQTPTPSAYPLLSNFPCLAPPLSFPPPSSPGPSSPIRPPRPAHLHRLPRCRRRLRPRRRSFPSPSPSCSPRTLRDVPQAVRSLFVYGSALVSSRALARPRLSSSRSSATRDVSSAAPSTHAHRATAPPSGISSHGWAELCAAATHECRRLSRSPDFPPQLLRGIQGVIRFPAAGAPVRLTFNPPTRTPEGEDLPFQRRLHPPAQIKLHFQQTTSALQLDGAPPPRQPAGNLRGKRLPTTLKSTPDIVLPVPLRQLWHLSDCAQRKVPRAPDQHHIRNAPSTAVTEARQRCVVRRPGPAAPRTGGGAQRGMGGRQGAGRSGRRRARCFPAGATRTGCRPLVTMGSSRAFADVTHANDFGVADQPVAVGAGRANKFDGKISAFPARAGGGAVELEVCLAPETMAALILDEEFMFYVSSSSSSSPP
ncbi:uncharacterized protein A4U43_C07F290 [Asparagus officinalis]|uniref:Uncharacterized protein n=1 Tax=Asparagus officinalis TaxID=4686 RepID=A0A5P1E8N4_ASPOF|nr:uncharacterized protein A4U43_C07F290 [Asparagus officinalis]